MALSELRLLLPAESDRLPAQRRRERRWGPGPGFHALSHGPVAGGPASPPEPAGRAVGAGRAGRRRRRGLGAGGALARREPRARSVRGPAKSSRSTAAAEQPRWSTGISKPRTREPSAAWSGSRPPGPGLRGRQGQPSTAGGARASAAGGHSASQRPEGRTTEPEPGSGDKGAAPGARRPEGAGPRARPPPEQAQAGPRPGTPPTRSPAPALWPHGAPQTSCPGSRAAHSPPPPPGP